MHLKLGLFEQLVNALDNDFFAFAYLAETFSSLSQAKIKEGIFIDPRIQKIVLDETFHTNLKRKEKFAFKLFKSSCAPLSFGIFFAENRSDVSDEHGERFH